MEEEVRGIMVPICGALNLSTVMAMGVGMPSPMY
jgi:hypothetical protein